jgi:peptidoglycan/LPS O-acetylase OafA/YrhL
MPDRQLTVEELKKLAAEKAQAASKAEQATTASVQQNFQPIWTPKIALGLSYSILVFGLLVLALMAALVAKYNVNINRLLRAFALVLIIVAAVFLIVAGYTEQQIAPVMGLLGTIAGYLLGSRHSSGESGDEEKQKA